MNKRISLLNPVIRRWINYFAISMIKGKLADIDTHFLTMLRKVIWK